MSRSGSYGGGKSSLGYLFGSTSKPANDHPPPSPSRVLDPPYGIDKEEDHTKPLNLPPLDQKHDKNNNYHRARGQNSENFITDRPTTKVKSAPGGKSSLGYLFGDK